MRISLAGNHPRDIRTPARSRMSKRQARESQKMRLTGGSRYQVDADDSESFVDAAAFTVRLSFANDPTHWQTIRDVLQAATSALPPHLPAPDPSRRVQHAPLAMVDRLRCNDLAISSPSLPHARRGYPYIISFFRSIALPLAIVRSRLGADSGITRSPKREIDNRSSHTDRSLTFDGSLRAILPQQGERR